MQPGMEVQGSTGSLLSLHMLNPMRRFYTSAGLRLVQKSSAQSHENAQLHGRATGIEEGYLRLHRELGLRTGE